MPRSNGYTTRRTRLGVGGYLAVLGSIIVATAAAADVPGWSIVASPNSSPSESNALWGVTCNSASDCWAIGARWNPNPFGQTSALGPPRPIDHTLIEHWDGGSWSIVPSPNTNTTTESNFLRAVACVSTDDCWAVGEVGIPARSITVSLIEHWDGATWTISNAPDAGTLAAVTCTSAADCWTVGSDSGIEHWDGLSWTVVIPRNIASMHRLDGVACPAVASCWAVGTTGGTAPVHTLVEHWDGNSWGIVSSPDGTGPGPGFSNELTSVACPGPAACWAAGFTSLDTGRGALFERWDGVSWTLVNPPATSTRGDTLNSLNCPSATDCWAAGSSQVIPSTNQTLIEHWDGVLWSLVPSPNSSAATEGGNNLLGVACASTIHCWSVGSYFTGPLFTGVERTLILEYPGARAAARIATPSAPAPQIPTPATGSASDVPFAGLGLSIVGLCAVLAGPLGVRRRAASVPRRPATHRSS